jgi:predicted RNA binding protein YcfA (HicA-like mRNA interferase family)
VQFPSLRPRDLLGVLMRKPLNYSIAHQTGSHRRLVSASGFPTLFFSFHDRVTIPPRVVRKILVQDVGLTEEQALELI